MLFSFRYNPVINKLSWLHFVHPLLSNLYCQLLSKEHAHKGFTKSQKLDIVLSCALVLLIFVSFKTTINQSTNGPVIRKKTSNKYSEIKRSDV